LICRVKSSALKNTGSALSQNQLEKILDNIAACIPKNFDQVKNFTVHDGYLGLSLFYCYYARYTDQDEFLAEAARCLNLGLELIDPSFYTREYQNDSYDYRLASLGAFFRQVNSNGFLHMEQSGFLDNLDEILVSLVRVKIKQNDYSRFSGALATGHYFYHADHNNPWRTRILEEIVSGLVNSSLKDKNGDLYWTSPRNREKIYFGPHGSAMNITFLALALKENIGGEACRATLTGAVRFVIKHLANQKDGLIPIFMGAPAGPTQFSQCYGDLGIAYALLLAAGVLNDQAIRLKADMVLTCCLNRQHEEGHTPDAGITYGAAGVSQLFGKIAAISNREKECKAAEEYWILQIPKYAIYDPEFAGFRSSLTQAPPVLNISYGWGIAGIGISLMRYLKPELPNLDGFSIYL